MDGTRRYLSRLGLLSRDPLDLPTSERRFPDDAEYRIEIPRSSGPDAFEAVLDEARERDVRGTASARAAGSCCRPTVRSSVARWASDVPHRQLDPARRRLRDDAGTGSIRDRRPIVEIPESARMPDGMTIDAEGALWVALWGGWAVHRYLPDGRLDAIVEIPTARVTSCSFGSRHSRTSSSRRRETGSARTSLPPSRTREPSSRVAPAWSACRRTATPAEDRKTGGDNRSDETPNGRDGEG